jgi:hypothetical protein
MKSHPPNATKIVSKLHFRIFLIFIGLTSQLAVAGMALPFTPQIKSQKIIGNSAI